MDDRTVGQIGERAETTCPQFRPVTTNGRYPVPGYCLLARWPGFLFPTISEHRDFCITARYPACRYFAPAAEAATQGEAEELRQAA